MITLNSLKANYVISKEAKIKRLNKSTSMLLRLYFFYQDLALK